MQFLFIYGCIVASYRWELRQYFRAKAYIIDVDGNVTGKYFWNHTMRKKGGYDFGDPIDSLSYAIGRNNRLRKETFFSEVIECTLLEPAETDHCEKAVLTLNKKITNRILYLN